MANIKISELTAITGANTAADDEFVIVDTSATETKKITRAELAAAIGAGVVDSVNGQTGDVVLDAADVGALALTGGTVTGDVSFGDSDKAIFGAGSDLEIYHDGSNSIVKDAGTGSLELQGSSWVILKGATSGVWGLASLDGAQTNLYHNGSLKLGTTAIGVDITGNATFADNGKAIFGAGSDLEIYHDGSNSYVKDAGTGDLFLQGSNNVQIESPTGSNMMYATAGAQVRLYYNGSPKFNTTPTGIEVTGSVVSQVGINAQTGTTYTTVLADQSKLVTLTNGSAITLTIPANSSVAYPVGTKIDFAQLGAGQVTVAGAGGVTVNATPTLKLRDQYSGASCIKTATDTWLLVGDLSGS